MNTRAWNTPVLSGNVTISYAKANSTVLTNGLTVRNRATLNITATSVNKSQVRWSRASHLVIYG
ncbi:hypothetical protein A0U89_12995 [Kozakia baliensis]|uniref:Uncharacterized protein n=1 Tax=Kozakia baliensis TaxID=153496 RepID=A0A1D8UW88_9PROT|nr:hypothetical protein A0U89_12995 [Kozakia baliensis]GEL64335.1 hypothetical protein KBA01_16210 [Kozakia baliensis]